MPALCEPCYRVVMRFASQYSLVFTAAKSKRIAVFFAKKYRKRWSFKPVFIVNCQSIEYVDECVHGGHVMSSDLNDARDIDRCRLALVRLDRLTTCCVISVGY